MAGQVLVGVAASPGLAAAPAVRWDGGHSSEAVAPAVTIDEASERVTADLRERAALASTAEGRAVLEALALFASDPDLLTHARTGVAAGTAPTEAVRAAAASYADQLRALGGYLGERADDVVDIGERLSAALEGRVVASLPSPGFPYVLVAGDLAPADTALLDPSVVLAIVIEQGGPTSHTAILARGLGIPAVVACRGARDAADGHNVAVDGHRGELHIDPDPETVTRLRDLQAQRVARAASAIGPGRTSDGVSVPLLVNVGTVRDAIAAADSDAEGIGLFRTEFLFLGRESEPTTEEQVETYSQVFSRFVGRRVVVRTLDAGSDKPLPFLRIPKEENPALGLRGLRTATVQPEVLERQLTALAAAAAATGTQPWVMAPMVSTVTEARWFAAQVRAAGLPTPGVMIEVPAAALRSAHVLAEVDFASLGTNDLGQYALAADRQLGMLGTLLDPWQPAVLALVDAACAGGRATSKPIGVCGEAASDPALAAVLVGLGVRSLSMAPVALPEVRALLRGVDLATCQRAAAAALAAPTAAEARSVAHAVLEP